MQISKESHVHSNFMVFDDQSNKRYSKNPTCSLAEYNIIIP